MLQCKTVIITGGNRGIGKETAKRLASEGGKIILACRDLEKAFVTKSEIVKETGNNNIVIRRLDIASQASVREFANEINSTEERLDILFHNAAVAEKFQLTEDGLDLTMATNYFGPFLLTHLLIDLLKKSAPSRIIVTSSVSYLLSLLNVDKIDRRPPPIFLFDGIAYLDSKLANILFTKELAHRLKDSGVTTNCFHPGLVDTQIWNGAPLFVQTMVKLLKNAFFISVEKAAETGVYLSISDEVKNVSGKYFVCCKQHRVWRCINNSRSEKLWEATRKIVKLLPTDPKI